MKEKRSDNRGQLDISFGMIFSIILIIIFLVFGFYAIKKIIELQQEVQIQQFLKDFQNDVDKMWKSPQGSTNVAYQLPTKITSICFVSNSEFENLKFTSKQIIAGKIINNIDVDKITKNESPFCIENVKGKVSMVITKSYGETLVTVTR
jgi:hypothetical protein